MEPKRKYVSLDAKVHHIKALHEGNGGFSGYASVFDIVDEYQEATVRGSFTKSLQTFISDGWLAEGHDWAKMGCGYVKDAYEDSYGLFVEFVYHGDVESQAIRQKITERIEAGKSVKLSIGYYLIGYEFNKDDGIMKLTEINLKEVSVVNVPALADAEVMTAKSFETLTFEEHGQLAAQVMTAFYGRAKSRIEARTLDRKAGAELSATNVAVIDKTLEAIDLLNEVKTPLKELADRNRKDLVSESTEKSLESEDHLPTDTELFKHFHELQHKYHELQQAA